MQINSYRFPTRQTAHLKRKAASVSAEAKAIAWKAQKRLCGRYKTLTQAGKNTKLVCVAIARELVGFIWDIACQEMPKVAGMALAVYRKTVMDLNSTGHIQRMGGSGKYIEDRIKGYIKANEDIKCLIAIPLPRIGNHRLPGYKPGFIVLTSNQTKFIGEDKIQLFVNYIQPLIWMLLDSNNNE